MKKRCLLFLAISLIICVALAGICMAEDYHRPKVLDMAEDFPDEHLREALAEDYTDYYGDLDVGSELSFTGKGIRSFKGLEKFPNLQRLSIIDNGAEIEYLNLHENKKLRNVTQSRAITIKISFTIFFLKFY